MFPTLLEIERQPPPSRLEASDGLLIRHVLFIGIGHFRVIDISEPEVAAELNGEAEICEVKVHPGASVGIDIERTHLQVCLLVFGEVEARRHACDDEGPDVLKPLGPIFEQKGALNESGLDFERLLVNRITILIDKEEVALPETNAWQNTEIEMIADTEVRHDAERESRFEFSNLGIACHTFILERTQTGVVDMVVEEIDPEQETEMNRLAVVAGQVWHPLGRCELGGRGVLTKSGCRPKKREGADSQEATGKRCQHLQRKAKKTCQGKQVDVEVKVVVSVHHRRLDFLLHPHGFTAI